MTSSGEAAHALTKLEHGDVPAILRFRTSWQLEAMSSMRVLTVFLIANCRQLENLLSKALFLIIFYPYWLIA